MRCWSWVASRAGGLLARQQRGEVKQVLARETNGGGSGATALSLLRGIAGRMLIRMLALTFPFAARAGAHLVVLKLSAGGFG